jgi:hypothetical protein
LDVRTARSDIETDQRTPLLRRPATLQAADIDYSPERLVARSSTNTRARAVNDGRSTVSMFEVVCGDAAELACPRCQDGL